MRFAGALGRAWRGQPHLWRRRVTRVRGGSIDLSQSGRWARSAASAAGSGPARALWISSSISADATIMCVAVMRAPSPPRAISSGRPWPGRGCGGTPRRGPLSGWAMQRCTSTAGCPAASSPGASTGAGTHHLGDTWLPGQTSASA